MNATPRIDLVRDVARVTVELASPLAIGSGAWDDLIDSPFAVDANGLPTLPGTSLAGVLRAAWGRYIDGSSVEDLFGYQKPASPGKEEEGRPSRVECSFGSVHDSRNRPVAPRLMPDDILADPLLRLARAAVVRPHVRLNHLGAADATGHGLYDRAQVAVGHRFTFEIAVLGDDESAGDLSKSVLGRLLALLDSGSVSLGSSGASGLGRLKLLRVLRRRFDLTVRGDFDDFEKLPVGIHEDVPGVVLPELPLVEIPKVGGIEPVAAATLRVTPRGFWLFGGGRPETAGERKTPDIAPYNEPRVEWSKKAEGAEQGEVVEAPRDVPIPGSAIKGALRHRTAYHLNRLNGVWADDFKDPDELEKLDGLGNSGVCQLFGEAVEHGGQGKEERGRAGRVRVEEIRVVPNGRSRIPHVALDRFTCGPIDGALFDEEALWKGAEWKLTVRVEPPAPSEKEVDSVAREALRLALNDLAQGRLQVGSGSGRGNGWLQGTLEWDENGKKWMGESGGAHESE